MQPSGWFQRALLVVVFCATSLGVLAGGSPARAALKLPPQGVYEGCKPSLGQECLDRLTDLRARGFTMVLNYSTWAASEAELRAWMDKAQQLGMKVIVPLNHPAWRKDEISLRSTYTRLAADCPCSSNPEFIAWMVATVKDHPALWGYYIGDETVPAEHHLVQTLADRLHVHDATHPHLFVSFENSYTDGRNLHPFADVADVVASDWYPVGAGWPLEDVGPLAQELQRTADAAGKRSAAVLQAFSWGEYHLPGTPWPTETEMLRMRNLTLRYSRVDFILWYSYYNILRSDDPEPRLQALTRAAFAPAPRAPDTTVNGRAEDAFASAVTAEFSSSSLDLRRFECRLDGQAWTPCQSPFRAAGLPAGDHTLEVAAVSDLELRDDTPATFRWRTVTAPQLPDTEIQGGPSDGVSRQARFTFASSAGDAGFECRLDDRPWTRCTSPYEFTQLPAGAHRFEVAAVTPAGLRDATPASHAWRVLRPLTLTVTKRRAASVSAWVRYRKAAAKCAKRRSSASSVWRCRSRQRVALLPAVTVRLSRPARVQVTVSRGGKVRSRYSERMNAGAGHVRLTRRLRPGRYTVAVQAATEDGVRARGRTSLRIAR